MLKAIWSQQRSGGLAGREGTPWSEMGVLWHGGRHAAVLGPQGDEGRAAPHKLFFFPSVFKCCGVSLSIGLALLQSEDGWLCFLLFFFSPSFSLEFNLPFFPISALQISLENHHEDEAYFTLPLSK